MSIEDKIEIPSVSADNLKGDEDLGDGIFLLREHVDNVGSEPLHIRDITVESDKGNVGVSMALSALGVSNVIKIPLPYSGFQVTLGIIPGMEKLALIDNITNEVNAGNIDTLATVNSTSDGVLGDLIMDAFQGSLISTTAKIPLSRVSDYIDCRDFDAIKNGVLQSIHPDGINSVTKCAKCGEKHDIELGLGELLYYNPDKLVGQRTTEDGDDIEEIDVTPTLMSKGKHSVTTEMLKEYADVAGFKEVLHLNENVSIEMGTSTIRGYLRDTNIWMKAVIASVDAAITSDDIPDNVIVATKKSIMQLGAVSSYLPYVRSISVKGKRGVKVITGREDILNILNGIITDIKYSSRLIEFFNESLKKHTISYIGFEAYTCDKCGEDMENSESEEKEIIPLNPSQLFLVVSTQIRLTLLRESQ